VDKKVRITDEELCVDNKVRITDHKIVFVFLSCIALHGVSLDMFKAGMIPS
jgi:hypothetical protein